MFLTYYDESGDDGYPRYSSPVFVLTCAYLHYLNWKEAYSQIVAFRRQLKRDFGFPVKMEFHAKYFLLNKNPYRNLQIADRDRLAIVDLFCGFVSRLNIEIVNVVINKQKIVNDDYAVMDRAFTYSIQRIENTLNKIDPANRFLIITDKGRLGMMKKTARRIQRINMIPSKFSGGAYRKEIDKLIEDPLEKDSKESYFIQISDLVAYIVYLWMLSELGVGQYSNRLPREVDRSRVKVWMDTLKGSLNLKAAQSDHYGIVCYPK